MIQIRRDTELEILEKKHGGDVGEEEEMRNDSVRNMLARAV